jgi:hypothetical protein
MYRRYGVGERLIVSDADGAEPRLVEDTVVTVEDARLYPHQFRQVVLKVGYNAAKYFVCVRNGFSNKVGFYSPHRFVAIDIKDI